MEARSVEGMGRGLFARAAISQGTEIYRAEPVVAHPSPSCVGRVCSHCLKPVASGQGTPHAFCSRACEASLPDRAVSVTCTTAEGPAVGSDVEGGGPWLLRPCGGGGGALVCTARGSLSGRRAKVPASSPPAGLRPSPGHQRCAPFPSLNLPLLIPLLHYSGLSTWKP